MIHELVGHIYLSCLLRWLTYGYDALGNYKNSGDRSSRQSAEKLRRVATAQKQGLYSISNM